MSFDGLTIAAIAVIGLVWLFIEFNGAREMIEDAPTSAGLVVNDRDGRDAVDRMRSQRGQHSGPDHEVENEDRQGEQRDREDEANDELRGGLFGGSGSSDHDAIIPSEADCTCASDGWCSEDEPTCVWCKTLDIYEPCPQLGFGCGAGCDCCTPAQQAAADGL